MIDTRFKNSCYRVSRFIEEIKYITKVWGVFIYYLVFRRKHRPKEFFYEDFKRNNKYTKIIKNDDYVFTKEHYNFWDEDGRWFKHVKVPYRYFQPFSDKTHNYHFRENCTLCDCIVNPLRNRIRVNKISDGVYYEGITFEKIDFISLDLNEVCFHNCVFESCDFKFIKTKGAFGCVTKELFSACEFKRSQFQDVDFHNTAFSMCSFNDVLFENVDFRSCIFHKTRFINVVFGKKIGLYGTCFLSPYRRFDISTELANSNIVIDYRSFVTTQESYIDSIDNIEEYFDSKNKIEKYSDFDRSKNTYHLFECLYERNGLTMQDDMEINPYYQKKKIGNTFLLKKKKKAKRLFG